MARRVRPLQTERLRHACLGATLAGIAAARRRGAVRRPRRGLGARTRRCAGGADGGGKPGDVIPQGGASRTALAAAKVPVIALLARRPPGRSQGSRKDNPLWLMRNPGLIGRAQGPQVLDSTVGRIPADLLNCGRIALVAAFAPACTVRHPRRPHPQRRRKALIARQGKPPPFINEIDNGRHRHPPCDTSIRCKKSFRSHVSLRERGRSMGRNRRSPSLTHRPDWKARHASCD